MGQIDGEREEGEAGFGRKEGRCQRRAEHPALCCDALVQPIFTERLDSGTKRVPALTGLVSSLGMV